MACLSPLSGERAATPNPETGKYPIVWRREESVGSGREVTVPCGKCIGCRVDKQRSWQIRCGHEQSVSRESWFVTLTYADGNLPKRGSLDIRDLQLFMKRLRKRVGAGVRFFACGEYGGTYGRAHLHVALFDCVFDKSDPARFRVLAPEGDDTHFIADIYEAWEYKGIISISVLVPERAGYIAKYFLKQRNGEKLAAETERVDPETGEIYHVARPFLTMSRGGRTGRKGIGMDWITNPTYAMQTAVLGDVMLPGSAPKKHGFPPPRAYSDYLRNVEGSDAPERVELAARFEVVKRRLQHDGAMRRLLYPDEYGCRRMDVKLRLAELNARSREVKRRAKDVRL